MAQQTALEWLEKKIKETYDKEGKLPLAYTLHLVKLAKGFEILRNGFSYNDMRASYAAGFTDGKTFGVPNGESFINSLESFKKRLNELKDNGVEGSPDTSSINIKNK